MAWVDTVGTRPSGSGEPASRDVDVGLPDTDEIGVARLRAVRLAAVERFIPVVMLANIAVTIAISALLSREHRTVTTGWSVTVIALSLMRISQARRATVRHRSSASARAIRRSTVQSIVMAALCTSVPAWLLGQTSGLTFTIIVCSLTGSLWAGSMVLATVMPAAIAYAMVMVALVDGFLLAEGCDVERLFLSSLVLVGAVTALCSAFQLSKLFFAGHRQRMDLERQGEVIGILLRDYEEQTSDWLWEVDSERRFRNPSMRHAQVLGTTPEAMAGRRFEGFLAQPSTAGNQDAITEIMSHVTGRRPFRDVVLPLSLKGELRWWSVSGRPTYDGERRFTGYRGVTTDITATRVAQLRISYLAHHDALTGLPNRSSFCEALDRSLGSPGRSNVVVFSMDLDGFKAVNDRHGHPVGDALLAQVAERLGGILHKDDVVARFGGDEFLVLLDRATDVASIEVQCRELVDGMARPFDLVGEGVTIGVSIGVAFGTSDGSTSDELIKNADAALYRAKGDGRGTFRFFEPEMDRRLQDRLQLIHEMRVALAKGQFDLHFQPFVDAGTGKVTGCEALLRWEHPVRGLVGPAEFIPLAEESRLIVPIGAWVIRQACLEAARWPVHQRVSVNISPVQFRDRSLPSVILAALTNAGLSPSKLEIEITETVLIDDSEAALDALRQIRGLGVRVALDDFGTGYSSLSYLRSFPFDKVKIDRSFVQDLASRHENQVIVQAIRDLARGLGMSITAEGVETEDQAERLRLTGCEELQGYLFSRPIPSDRYAETFGGVPMAAAG